MPSAGLQGIRGVFADAQVRSCARSSSEAAAARAKPKEVPWLQQDSTRARLYLALGCSQRLCLCVTSIVQVSSSCNSVPVGVSVRSSYLTYLTYLPYYLAVQGPDRYEVSTPSRASSFPPSLSQISSAFVRRSSLQSHSLVPLPPSLLLPSGPLRRNEPTDSTAETELSLLPQNIQNQTSSSRSAVA